MNNKRFTFKLLGVFLMDILNFSGVELRKTLWACVFGIAFLKVVSAFVDLLPMLLSH